MFDAQGTPGPSEDDGGSRLMWHTDHISWRVKTADTLDISRPTWAKVLINDESG